MFLENRNTGLLTCISFIVLSPETINPHSLCVTDPPLACSFVRGSVQAFPSRILCCWNWYTLVCVHALCQKSVQFCTGYCCSSVYDWCVVCLLLFLPKQRKPSPKRSRKMFLWNLNVFPLKNKNLTHGCFKQILCKSLIFCINAEISSLVGVKVNFGSMQHLPTKPFLRFDVWSRQRNVETTQHFGTWHCCGNSASIRSTLHLKIQMLKTIPFCVEQLFCNHSQRALCLKKVAILSAVLSCLLMSCPNCVLVVGNNPLQTNTLFSESPTTPRST